MKWLLLSLLMLASPALADRPDFLLYRHDGHLRVMTTTTDSDVSVPKVKQPRDDPERDPGPMMDDDGDGTNVDEHGNSIEIDWSGGVLYLTAVEGHTQDDNGLLLQLQQDRHGRVIVDLCAPYSDAKPAHLVFANFDAAMDDSLVQRAFGPILKYFGQNPRVPSDTQIHALLHGVHPDASAVRRIRELVGKLNDPHPSVRKSATRALSADALLLSTALRGVALSTNQRRVVNVMEQRLFIDGNVGVLLLAWEL